MLVEVHGDPSSDGDGDHVWSVSSGVIDHIDGHEAGSVSSLEQIVQHEFVGDTKDGGLAICIDKFDGRSIPFFSQGPDGPKSDTTPEELRKMLQHDEATDIDTHLQEAIDRQQDRADLDASCHCGGVRFQVTRPSKASRECSSPWPDLVVAYHSASSENHDDVKWWLTENDTKYMAGTCACRSCRLGSGSPIQAWAFIPKANIVQLDGMPLTYAMGTLKQIESSNGCYREFCSRCGATVFWHCLERPDLIDVSVGLLRAREGARASTWLEWRTERVSFKEMAFDKKLVDQFELGLQNLGSFA